MIKQCKGKDLAKVPKSKLLLSDWFPSIKYDGNYVQIHKIGNTVKFFTSGGKEFYFDLVAHHLIEMNPVTNFIIECEWIAETDGKLGARTKCSTGSYRANYAKGIKSKVNNEAIRFMAFDILQFDSSTITMSEKAMFKDRIKFFNMLEFPMQIVPVSKYEKSFDLNDINIKSFINEGYEGIFIKHATHIQEEGKRVNTAIKLKDRPTADLLCIDVLAGEGKYEELIGSLVLKDKEGRIVSVGSGLDDNQRGADIYLYTDKGKSLYKLGVEPDWYIGKVIEIKYEQIIDTYIQPTFVRVREDKGPSDID